MKKLLLVTLAASGLFAVPTPEASAGEIIPVSRTVPTVMPAIVHQAPIVVVEGRRRRYRRVRRVYVRHGRRVVVYRRVYY